MVPAADRPPGPFLFRRVAREDEALLADWLRRPHIAAWFPGTETQLASIMKHLDDDWIRVSIVSLDGRDVGYLQCYQADREPSGSWRDQPAGTRGTDQFLAEPDLLNCGLGTAMMHQVVADLFAEPETIRVITDPDPANGRAIRCYEKAGFRQVGSVDKPWGTTLLMAQDRPGSN